MSDTPKTDALIDASAVRLKAFMDGTELSAESRAIFDKVATYIEDISDLSRKFERELAEARASENCYFTDAEGFQLRVEELEAYARALEERAERMRQHILTKVVGRLCDVPSGKFHGEWGCGLCGGVGKGPASGVRELETIQHTDDCMARSLEAAPSGRGRVQCIYREGCRAGMSCETEGRCLAPSIEQKLGVGPHAEPGEGLQDNQSRKE